WKNTPIQTQERQQAQHDHHHARDTARSPAEHLLWAMAGGKSRRLRASIHSPIAKKRHRKRRIPAPFRLALPNA
ncbi:MAG: hypothetical protein ACHQPH_13945, partial [Reyranellales bacterium]